ncbi:MAG TPA: hypothetical protein GX401_01850 [Clostridiales bacterium]|nr:hypothetical protein [Clostridiales bacterium]
MKKSYSEPLLEVIKYSLTEDLLVKASFGEVSVPDVSSADSGLDEDW